MQIVFASFVFILGCSHQNEGDDSTNKIIAKAYQYRLTSNELENVLPKNTSVKDSVLYANNEIDKWIIDHVMLHNAELSLTQQEKAEIRARLQEFKESLLINAFEKKMINEKLDTIISENELKRYYQKYKTQFTLKDLLVKVMYIKIPLDAPDLSKVKKWVKLRNEEDSLALDNYAKRFALNYYYDKTSWLYLDDLKKEIPINNDLDDDIKSKNYTSFAQDGSAYYFVHIFDFLSKDAIAPLELEKEAVKQAILTERIYKLRKQIKKEILEKAYEDDAIEK